MEKTSLWLILSVTFMLTAQALVLGCSKPYIGRTIRHYNDHWCTFNGLPANCMVGGEDTGFAFEYTVKSSAGEYVIEGDALWKGTVGMTTLYEISAAFILAKDRVVTDYIPFGIFPRDLRSPIHFKKTFQTTDFEAVFITYRGRVHD